MWYLIFAETIPVPNWTGLLTGGCVGSFVTFVALVVFGFYSKSKDKKEKSKGIPLGVIANLDSGDGQKPS